MKRPTTQTTTGIVWFELPATDGERAQSLYGRRFRAGAA